MPPIQLAELVALAGSQSALASAIGTSQQLVSYWVRMDKPLPAEFVLATERALGVSRHRLRPDIYPPAEHESSPPEGGDSIQWPIAAPGKGEEVSGSERTAA